MGSTRGNRNRVRGAAVIAVLAATSAACITPGTGGTTTTASTTSPVPGSSTPINPNCGLYTPSAVALDSSDVSSGDTVNVSGNGVEGTTIVLKIRKISGGTVIDPNVTTVVGAGGTWTTPVTLPTLTPGVHEFVATAQGCTGEATALFNVV